MEHPLKISFCTTCMGRLEHLKQTLPQNIRDAQDYPNAQFVVLNYGTNSQTQEIEDWIHDNFKEDIASGRLKYVAYPAAQHFHMAHAKNMAHRMGDGDILCNVDADQFIGKGFAQMLEEEFTKAAQRRRRIFMRHGSVEMTMTSEEHHGSLGKIAVAKKDFEELRGYREDFHGWGGEDGDFITRMLIKRFSHVKIPLELAQGMSHDNDTRLANYSEKDRAASREKVEETYSGKENRHIQMIGKVRNFTRHVTRNLMVATNPEGFGMGEVFVNFSSAPIELGQIAQKQQGQAGAAALARV